MRYLLDTHALIWAIADPDRLPQPVRDEVVDPANVILVSVASAWEVAIKRAIGKLNFSDITAGLLDRYGFERIDIRLDHVATVTTLPPLHHDPFDRMLVAQAEVDDLTIMTRDAHIQLYDVRTIW